MAEWKDLRSLLFFFNFFFYFTTCYMTLTLDKRNQDKLSRRLEAALSTDTSGTLILSSYISTVSSFSAFSKLSSLTLLIFILTLKPVLYFVLTVANFALWIWPLCFSLGLSNLIFTFIMLFLVSILYPTLRAWPLTLAKIQVNSTVQPIRRIQILLLFLTS